MWWVLILLISSTSPLTPLKKPVWNATSRRGRWPSAAPVCLCDTAKCQHRPAVWCNDLCSQRRPINSCCVLIIIIHRCFYFFTAVNWVNLKALDATWSLCIQLLAALHVYCPGHLRKTLKIHTLVLNRLTFVLQVWLCTCVFLSFSFSNLLSFCYPGISKHRRWFTEDLKPKTLVQLYLRPSAEVYLFGLYEKKSLFLVPVVWLWLQTTIFFFVCIVFNFVRDLKVWRGTFAGEAQRWPSWIICTLSV